MQLVGISSGDRRGWFTRLSDKRKGIALIDRKNITKDIHTGNFDVIVSQFAIEHAYDPLMELKMLYRALRQNGVAYIQVWKSNMARKFDAKYPSAGVNDGISPEAFRDLENFYMSLAARGIAIEGKQNYLFFRKNSVPLKFPEIHYAEPVDAQGNGLYRFDESLKKTDDETAAKLHGH